LGPSFSRRARASSLVSPSGAMFSAGFGVGLDEMGTITLTALKIDHLCGRLLYDSLLSEQGKQLVCLIFL